MEAIAVALWVLAVRPPVPSGVALNFVGAVLLIGILILAARWVASRPRRPRGRITTQAHEWLRTTEALHHRDDAKRRGSAAGDNLSR